MKRKAKSPDVLRRLMTRGEIPTTTESSIPTPRSMDDVAQMINTQRIKLLETGYLLL